MPFCRNHCRWSLRCIAELVSRSKPKASTDWCQFANLIGCFHHVLDKAKHGIVMAESMRRVMTRYKHRPTRNRPSLTPSSTLGAAYFVSLQHLIRQLVHTPGRCPFSRWPGLRCYVARRIDDSTSACSPLPAKGGGSCSTDPAPSLRSSYVRSLEFNCLNGITLRIYRN